MAIVTRGRTPIDQVDVEAAIQQAADHTAVWLQIQNVRPIYQSKTNQHWFGELNVVVSIMQQP